MHGRKREEYKAAQRNPRVIAGLASKAQKWNDLYRQFLSQRQSQDIDITKSAAATQALLTVNPDSLALWSARREMMIAVENRSISYFTIDTELSLTQTALQNNAKSYGAWFHRKWSLMYFRAEKDKLKQELGLTELFLQLDERNFHCWNYRRFVVSCLGALEHGLSLTEIQGCWALDESDNELVVMGPQVIFSNAERKQSDRLQSENPSVLSASLLRSEWEFTTKKIKDNFSNFSAFHYRSKLLPSMLSTIDWKEELQLIENAVFTEPDDQTAWWYHRFLLTWIDNDSDLLKEHAESLRELMEEESKSKWVLMGLWHILEKLKAPGCEELLHRLLELDPDRSARYNYLVNQYK